MKLFNKRSAVKLNQGDYILTEKEKAASFFLNPAMIIAIGYMLYITSLYVGFEF